MPCLFHILLWHAIGYRSDDCIGFNLSNLTVIILKLDVDFLQLRSTRLRERESGIVIVLNTVKFEVHQVFIFSLHGLHAVILFFFFFFSLTLLWNKDLYIGVVAIVFHYLDC
jgi:hypothetical protein